MKLGIATGDFTPTAEYEDGNKILGGAGYIRIAQYLPYSALGGIVGELIWNAEDEEFGVRDWQGVEHWGFDAILMQRWMHDSIPDRIRIVQKKGQVIINDIDDWYWGLSPENKAFWDSHPKTNPNENINHFRKTLARSDAVITSTPYLADRLSQFVKPDKIHIQLNHVDISRFTPWEHTEASKPVIGWLGSTAHRSGDLAVLKSVYNMLGTQDWGYHHSGHIGWFPPFYEEVGLGKDDVTILPPAPGPELEILMRFDIGVVPLVQVPFNEAKSWIKGLEYAAAGIPFVASSSEAYRSLRDEYGVGIVAKRQNDWIKAFTKLRDPKFRQDMADQNRERIQPLDTRYGAAKWDSLITDIVKSA